MKNFDLRVSDHDGYAMCVAVIYSQAGNVAPTEVDAPSFTAASIADLNDAELRDIAADFTASVLPAAVWQAWRESWAAAGDEGIRLRVRCADVDCLRIPWELLYDVERQYFLARDPRSPIVRYLEGPIPDTTKPIEAPLRLLLTSASPTDQDKLEVGKELDGIEAALAEAKQAGRVEITRLDDLTLDALDRALLKVKPHVFHFSGHGEWDEDAGAGHLMLNDGTGATAKLADHMLAMLLRNRDVALVVLNACETAMGGDAWAGLAQSLVLARVPAVVAMQMPVTDAAAAAFTGTLYAALANDYSLEQAVTLARQTTARQPEDVADPGEWLAPALFMRTGSEQFWLREQVDKVEADAGGISIGKIEAANVALGNQTIDQRGANIIVGDRNVKAERIENSTIQTGDNSVSTGGGAYIGGSVSVGGDFVGRDKIVTGGSDDKPDLNKAFTQLMASVALEAPTADVAQAMQLVTAMQQALVGQDDDKVADCIGDLADLAPGVKETLKLTFSQPPLGEHVGPAAKYALRRLG